MGNIRYDFTGKTVIVTGGVSGIGRAVSLGFARAGANVVMCCLPGEALGPVSYREVLDEGGKAILVEVDISDEEQVEAMVQKAIEAFGKVDIFVSNAAAFDGYRKLLDTTPEQWRRVMDVNLNGNYYICRHILPHMLSNGGGVLVFVSSIAGVIAGHGGAAYTTSKHGVNGLVKQITFDYGREGIRANAVCPGSTYTPLSAAGLETEKSKKKLSWTPYGTYGQPEFIANEVLYLASDEAEFIYGTVRLVDGGNQVRKWE